MFKVISSRYLSEIEEEINKLVERYKPVDVQTMAYNEHASQYVAVIKLGDKILPNTYYPPTYLE